MTSCSPASPDNPTARMVGWIFLLVTFVLLAIAALLGNTITI